MPVPLGSRRPRLWPTRWPTPRHLNLNRTSPPRSPRSKRYALHHRKRTVLIRRLDHLPPKFGWLAPEAVHAAATNTTPICARSTRNRPG
jgi:hypothetical protein